MTNKKTSIHFSKYAENKFEILNRHDVYFTRELIEDCVISPDQTGKISEFDTAQKEGVKVVYKKELGIITILTFYPIQNEL